jgi:hypothetical protein
VRPSGDDPNFFSTSTIGSVFKSSFASGFDPGLDAGAVGFDSADALGFGSGALGWSAAGGAFIWMKPMPKAGPVLWGETLLRPDAKARASTSPIFGMPLLRRKDDNLSRR